MRKLILALALPALLGGCYVAGSSGAVAYAEVSPPPPPYVVVDARPGYVWVDGHYYWRNSWLWSPGYYLVDRPGYVWVQGSYYGRRYRPGYWDRAPHYRPSGGSQAGQVVRGGSGRVRQVAPSRAGQVVAPQRSAPARSQPVRVRPGKR